jgi:hypothetical protein
MRAKALAAILLMSLTAARAPPPPPENNLFISPAGEPFLAPSTQPFPIVAWFNGADANHDGKLDADEFRADAVRFFNVLDRNKDGFLVSLEIYIYEHVYVPEILTAQGPPPPVEASTDSDTPPRARLDTQQGAVQFSLFSEPEPVLSADRNLDGRVSLAEFKAQADRHFAALDPTGRGYLTLDSLPQTPAEKAVKGKRR